MHGNAVELVAPVLLNGPLVPATTVVGAVQLSLAGGVGPDATVAIAVCRPALSTVVPELLPPVAVQPALVWIATARPLASTVTTEPELPPQVSIVWLSRVPTTLTRLPVCVCWVWLRAPLGLVQLQLDALGPLLTGVPSRP